jgi:hypothetical protein
MHFNASSGAEIRIAHGRFKLVGKESIEIGMLEGRVK